MPFATRFAVRLVAPLTSGPRASAPPRRPRSAFWTLAAIASLAAGCTTSPPGSTPPPAAADRTAESPRVAETRVLGRSERFVVYQPAPGDTLASIADRFLGDASRGWVIGDFNDVAEAEPDRPLAVPLVPINPGQIERDRYQTVPILCYHRFGNAGGKMVVSAAKFEAQLEWLARHRYRVIPLTQLPAFLEGRAALPKRSVVLTIDDGYESVYRIAWPLLRKYGVPATLFLYTDFIGAGDALSWPQLREMAASGVVDLQAHSKTHRNLIDRATESDDRYRQALEAETREPRDTIERRIGNTVNAYAYPFGDANQPLLDALARQHYQLGLTVNPGGNGFQAQPLMLRRTMIYGDLDLAGFRAKLQIARPVGSP